MKMAVVGEGGTFVEERRGDELAHLSDVRGLGGLGVVQRQQVVVDAAHVVDDLEGLARHLEPGEGCLRGSGAC